MRPINHIAVSTAFSACVYAASHSWQMTAASWISGWLVDVDHFIDYVLHFDLRRFTVDHFFRASYDALYDRCYLFFHGWEWVILAYLVSWLSGWNPWLLGLTLGYTQHLTLDQLFNKSSRWGYWLTFRVSRRFRYLDCFPSLAEVQARQAV